MEKESIRPPPPKGKLKQDELYNVTALHGRNMENKYLTLFQKCNTWFA